MLSNLFLSEARGEDGHVKDKNKTWDTQPTLCCLNSEHRMRWMWKQGMWKQGTPRTSRRFERTEPKLERPATSFRYFFFFDSATHDRMSSTTLPNVALTRPPMTSPERSARSSVTSPRMSARGMIPIKFCILRGSVQATLAECTSTSSTLAALHIEPR
jgi:hypothetical protein